MTGYTTGSYVSPILDLGEANNWFYNAVTFAIDTPSDSTIDLYAYLEGLGWSPIATNQSIGYEFGRYIQIQVNFTSSSDFCETPSFYWLQLNWTETVPNNAPYIDYVQPANNTNNLDLNVNIYCCIYDADNDLLNVSFYINDTLTDKLVNWNATYNANFFQYSFGAEYSSSYVFYWIVNDSEDCVNSGLYFFSTLTPPEVTGMLAIKLSTFSYNISCIPIQYSAGMLDLQLYWDNDTPVSGGGQAGVANNTRWSCIINFTTYGVYEFYWDVNVGENIISSPNFDVIILAPAMPTTTLNFSLILTIALAFLLALIIGGVMFHKANPETKAEKREKKQSRSIRFITLLLLKVMGCGTFNAYSPSLGLVETGDKKQNQGDQVCR
jgi:hypothetical protein